MIISNINPHKAFNLTAIKPAASFSGSYNESEVAPENFTSGDNGVLDAPWALPYVPYKPKTVEKITIPVDLTYKTAEGVHRPGKRTGISPYPVMEKRLQRVNGINKDGIGKSYFRIKSLSNYLKYKMVGFVVPEYEIEGEKKGGYQWFERGLLNIIKGAKKPDLYKEDYVKTAKEFFGLLSMYDRYWISKDFRDYLESLKQSPTINEEQKFAVNATIQAVKELNHKKNGNNGRLLNFGSKEPVTMKKEFFSPMKAMPEIYASEKYGGCAYSGRKLSRAELSEISKAEKVSIEHIIPRSWAEDMPNIYEEELSDDGNYFIVSMHYNEEERKSLPLIRFLKGW